MLDCVLVGSKLLSLQKGFIGGYQIETGVSRRETTEETLDNSRTSRFIYGVRRSRNFESGLETRESRDANPGRSGLSGW